MKPNIILLIVLMLTPPDARHAAEKSNPNIMVMDGLRRLRLWTLIS